MSVDATSVAVRHRLKQRPFLIGFMGNDKSMVTSTLSTVLGPPALDGDACLEQELGCSITDFFSREGEQAFRDREIKFSRNLRGQSPYLISCGGGMALRSEDRVLMRLLGPVIYLTVTSETVFSCIGTDTVCPLLKDKKAPANIAAMMQARPPPHEDVVSLKTATDYLSPAEITNELIRLLQSFLSGDEFY